MAKTKAQEFLDQVLARVPEAEREAVRSLYSSAMDEVTAGQRTLDDAMAAVRETATKQNEWWNAHKDTVAENAALKKKLDGGGGGTGLTSEEITKQLGALEDRVMGTGLSVMATMSNISTKHLKEFGEEIDMLDLAQRAIKANTPLQEYYNSTVADRRATRDAEARKQEIAAATEAGKKAGIEETTKLLGNREMPFPGTSTAAAMPSTLSGLKKPVDGSAPPDVLAAAVATANEVASRGAS